MVFLDESCFNLWDQDGRIRVRRYCGERCFPECVTERHSGLIPGVMVWVKTNFQKKALGAAAAGQKRIKSEKQTKTAQQHI
ncbi:hypothetical protein TNCV_4366951 [Trichonephila clavipes]|nr:hypothetical protein TNCV_4366951 [Trichonephila clavipes]